MDMFAEIQRVISVTKFHQSDVSKIRDQARLILKRTDNQNTTTCTSDATLKDPIADCTDKNSTQNLEVIQDTDTRGKDDQHHIVDQNENTATTKVPPVRDVSVTETTGILTNKTHMNTPCKPKRLAIQKEKTVGGTIDLPRTNALDMGNARQMKESTLKIPDTRNTTTDVRQDTKPILTYDHSTVKKEKRNREHAALDTITTRRAKKTKKANTTHTPDI